MGEKKKITTAISLTRFWIHECTCVFGDRLVNAEDKLWLNSQLEMQLIAHTNINVEELYREGGDVTYADFTVPGADPRVYEEVSVTALQGIVEEFLNERNAESTQPMNLVMFKDALLHVVRTARILRQPSGHALLLGVGGSGRQSLTRLATYISGYKLFQIEILKGYGVNDWKGNVKECLLIAGLQDKPIVFLFTDSQIMNETMLEDVNSILNSGDVANIYTQEDLDLITATCKQDCIKKRIRPTKMNTYNQYVLRVRSNIHVVLCMSPLGPLFRSRLRKFPSLTNCCTIDWFTEWPDEALQSVAARFMISSSISLPHNVEKGVILFFQFIHQSIEKASVEFLTIMKRHFSVTPTSYLELLATYDKTLSEKRVDIGTLRDRLKVGVEKLVSTENAVNELQANLTEMEPKLIQSQRDMEAPIAQLTRDKVGCIHTLSFICSPPHTSSRLLILFTLLLLHHQPLLPCSFSLPYPVSFFILPHSYSHAPYSSSLSGCCC